MTNQTTKDKLLSVVSNAAYITKGYFRNLWEAIIGQTASYKRAMHAAVDGVSDQVFELMLEKEHLQKELEDALNRLGKKPTKKTATTARKAPKKKASGK